MGNHHTIFIDTCPDCGGDGGFESMPTGYSHIKRPAHHALDRMPDVRGRWRSGNRARVPHA